MSASKISRQQEIRNELGWYGRVCPVCDRMVKSGVRWEAKRPGFAPMQGVPMCDRCAAALRVREGRKCPGWIIPELREVVRPLQRCNLHPLHRCCLQCGQSPLHDLTIVGRALDVGQVACPKCLAAKRLSLPLECVFGDDDYSAVWCRSCRDSYILSGVGRDWARAALAFRGRAGNWQRSCLAQWREFMESEGPLPPWVQSGFCSHLIAFRGDDAWEILGCETLRSALLSRGGRRPPPLVLRLPD